MLKNILIFASVRDACPDHLISSLQNMKAMIHIDDPSSFPPKGIHLFYLKNSVEDVPINSSFPERSILISEKSEKSILYNYLKAGFVDAFLSPLNMTEFIQKICFLNEKCLSLEIAHLKKVISSSIDLPLTKKESQILELLLSSQNVGVNRAELNSYCWPGVQVELKALDVHLFNLRRKLEPKGITVEYGKGKWFLKGLDGLI